MEKKPKIRIILLIVALFIATNTFSTSTLAETYDAISDEPISTTEEATHSHGQLLDEGVITPYGVWCSIWGHGTSGYTYQDEHIVEGPSSYCSHSYYKNKQICNYCWEVVDSFTHDHTYVSPHIEQVTGYTQIDEHRWRFYFTCTRCGYNGSYIAVE